MRQFQAVTGACMFVRREVFERIGGFDDRYLNSHEDIDLCLRIGEAGFRIMYCPESLVYHYESVSEGRLDNVVKSRKVFCRRWNNKLKEDYSKFYKEDGFNSRSVVSIVMVTLNELDYTRQCIDWIFNTTKIPFELIVVDSGSTDGTREFLAQCGLLKYVFTDVNSGPSGPVNEGIKYCLGRKIVLLRQDIVIAPNWLENLLAQPNNPNLIRR